GGLRNFTDDGEVVTQVANSIWVKNGADTALEAPEILLVTKVGDPVEDPNAAKGILIDSGSVIRAVGAPVDGGTAAIIIGDVDTGVSGAGALVAVSNGAALFVDRRNKGSGGLIDIRTGPDSAHKTTIAGASFNLGTTGDIKIATTNDNIALDASDISI